MARAKPDRSSDTPPAGLTRVSAMLSGAICRCIPGIASKTADRLRVRLAFVDDVIDSPASTGADQLTRSSVQASAAARRPDSAAPSMVPCHS